MEEDFPKLIFEFFEKSKLYLEQSLERLVEERILAPIDALRARILYSLLSLIAFGVALIFISIGIFKILENMIGEIESYLLVGVFAAILGFVALRRSTWKKR
ncbi:MAG: hypothetical protein ACE5K0_10895 [Candidatus Methanofastidiosia archaeon]